MALSPTAGASRASSRAAAQAATPYLDALIDYAARGAGRLHVPGHKGGAAAGSRLLDVLGPLLALDVPACTRGIDVGGRVTPLDEAQALAAEAWGAARTWFLVNGASEANHALCLALRSRGDRVVVQRNVHSSAINGLVLAGLRPTFVAPEVDAERGIAHCLTPDQLAAALDRTPGAVAALVVSPTYFGATADVRSFAAICRERGVTLVVDEAWGGHFPFHPDLPEHAIAAGADAAVAGIHKTVGSLTQSAMLHVGAAADPALPDAIERALGAIRSTSPSSLLLASLDAARRDAAVDGHARLDAAIAGAERARERARRIPGVDVLDRRLVGHTGVFDFDPLRLALDVVATGRSGYAIADALHRRADVNLEMVTDRILIGHLGMGDPEEGASHLLDALPGALAEVPAREGDARTRPFAQPPAGPLVVEPAAAFHAPRESVPLGEAAGRVAAESLTVYPPGIANVMPGELITEANVRFLERTLRAGGHVRGSADPELRTVEVTVREQSR
ncbi:MAG: arginine decarboxylase [Thermoleophilaceae bacterium]|nr:arginine decarboxylase [Thermoleophilaceae bacterium]